MQASLIMFKADGERREFPLTKPSVVIGRKNTCDLRIPLSSVSRQHCQIEQRDGTLYLRDLGSSNGTFHNDTRVMEAELSAGDRITVGAVHFTLAIDGEPSDVEPVRTVLPAGAQASSIEEKEAMASGELVTMADDEGEELDLPVGPVDEASPATDDIAELDDVLGDAPPPKPQQPPPMPKSPPATEPTDPATPVSDADIPAAESDEGEDPISALEAMAMFDEDDEDDEPLAFDSDEFR